MSCHCVPEEIIWQTAVFQAVRSLGSRGVLSVLFQKPGEIEKLKLPWRSVLTAGPYWCQESGWLAQER